MEGKKVYKPHRDWTYQMVAAAEGVLGKPTVVIKNLPKLWPLRDKRERQL
jgi:hypothetical protein